MKTSSRSRRTSKISLLGSSVGFLFLSICLSIAISPQSVEKLVVAQEQSSSSGAASIREEIAKDVKDEITLLPKYSPDSVSQTLNYSHFVPLSPLSNSPGNQVKLLLNYNVTESSLLDNPINAIMEVYAANQSLVRTSSLPHPLNLTSSEGTIQLATTLNDNNLQNITAVAMLTDDEKAIPISNVLEARLNLGEMNADR
ncbi:MAG: hypothetical protein WBV84_10925 [Nitrososphaeraceae archaeon]